MVSLTTFIVKPDPRFLLRAIPTNTPPAVGLTMLAADERTIHRRSATYRSVRSQQKASVRRQRDKVG